jgi:phosphohistidine swiveling domain-containing protein
MLDWQTTFQAGPEAVGGKGWNLGRLHRYGFSIPPGGVIHADGYRLFLQEPGLQGEIAALASVQAEEAAHPEVAARLQSLRAQIGRTPLPPPALEALIAFLTASSLLQRPVAVRSSATAEDAAAASFAGIHRSLLNVTGVAAITAAVKDCYASLWTPQALAYRRRFNLADDQVAAAVVVMAMVRAHTAGVAFSCDPRTGRFDRQAVSASWGLGESVVSGAVEPDEYLIDITPYPPVIAARRLGSKAHQTVALPEGGTELRPFADQGPLPALTDLHLLELSNLIGRIHDSLGQMEEPQDIEWAHDGEQFWLLQARPVTKVVPATFPQVADQPVIWSNANLKDVLPGVQSTLGWSFLRSGIEILLAAPLRAAGYTYEGGVRWARLFEGRPYFNLSALQWAYYDALGILPREMSRILGGHQPEIAVEPPTVKQRWKRGMQKLRMMRHTAQAMRSAPAEFDRLWRWAQAAEAEPLQDLSPQQLLCKLILLKGVLEGYLPRFNLINGAAGGIHQELMKTLEPLFGTRSPGLVNAMLAGSGEITSAQQGERLAELGNLALVEEVTRSYFEDPDFDPVLWQSRLALTRFGERFTTYLKDYGHRGVYELEPMNPRWNEDPTYLLQTVRSQVLAGHEVRLQGQSAKREGARQEVYARIGFSPRRFLLTYYLGQAVRAASLREMGKSVLVKVAGISRYLALEIGRRMIDRGMIRSADAVFHLSWYDLEAWLLERPGSDRVAHLIQDRLTLRERYLKHDPPYVVTGETPMPRAQSAAALQGDQLTGLGVSSGRVTGIARLIRHPDEGAMLQPGEILVAPSTDPAWTPLFLRAAAIAMEVGGYLSHGSIVAREYGLPAVVNIAGLLESVQDGQMITIDGDEGKIYLAAGVKSS